MECSGVVAAWCDMSKVKSMSVWWCRQESNLVSLGLQWCPVEIFKFSVICLAWSLITNINTIPSNI